MKPVDFPEKTKTLTAPANMTNQECESLFVWNDGRESISLWKPLLRERLSILFFGRVWLHVLAGSSQPPVFVQGKREIFKEAEV